MRYCCFHRINRLRRNSLPDPSGNRWRWKEIKGIKSCNDRSDEVANSAVRTKSRVPKSTGCEYMTNRRAWKEMLLDSINIICWSLITC